MKHNEFKRLGLLVLALCLFAGTACAEKMTLAFGYEADLMEGVKITKEEWTPENRRSFYRLNGTYENGKERFLVVWCDFEYKPRSSMDYGSNDRVNFRLGSLYGYLIASSDVGGKDDEESERFQLLVNGMSDFAKHIQNALDHNGTYEYAFKKRTPIALPSCVTLDEGQLNMPQKMKAEYGNEKLVVMDENEHTVLWLSVLPETYISYYFDIDQLHMRDSMISDMAYFLTDVGLSKYKYDLSEETLKSNAWWGSRSEACILAPERNGKGFAVLKVFREEPPQLVVYEGGCSQDEALAMAYSAMLFKAEPAEGKILPHFWRTDDGEGVIKYALPVGRNQFVVDIAGYDKDLIGRDMECEESEYEEGLETTWGYTDEYDHFNEILTYQYLPMPEAFKANTATMTDEAYITLLEEALVYVGEKHLDKLQSVYPLKDGQAWTKEYIREHTSQIIEMLDGPIKRRTKDDDGRVELKNASAVVRYFEPIDREEIMEKYTAWNAGSRRWVEVNDFDLFGQSRDDSVIALFDGALHLITTYYDSGCATSSFRLNDGSATAAIRLTGTAGEGEAGKQTAVVATKSSPLTMRTTPGKNGTKVMSIPKGETVVVLESGDWPLVEYQGKRGYVNGIYLK